MKQIFCVLAVFNIIITSLSAQTKAPVMDLGHLDLVVDSADFAAWQQHPFVKQFAILQIDTTLIMGKASYELNVLGQEAFFHVNLDKGYWQNKTATGALVFITRHPDQYQHIIQAWKQHYPDSLYQKLQKMPDFEVGEVSIHHERDTTQPAYARIYPLVISFNTQGYRNWGFSEKDINSGISMRQFMYSWDKSVDEKLFKRISEVHIQLTKKELQELRGAMVMAGYRQTGNSFSHPENPMVYYNITKENLSPKIRKIVAELSGTLPAQEFAVGSFLWVVKGNRVEIISSNQ